MSKPSRFTLFVVPVDLLNVFLVSFCRINLLLKLLNQYWSKQNNHQVTEESSFFITFLTNYCSLAAFCHHDSFLTDVIGNIVTDRTVTNEIEMLVQMFTFYAFSCFLCLMPKVLICGTVIHFIGGSFLFFLQNVSKVHSMLLHITSKGLNACWWCEGLNVYEHKILSCLALCC